MTIESRAAHSGSDQSARAGEKHAVSFPTRRALVSGGVKLVFIPPVLSTFFASSAYAGSKVRTGCLKNGSPCTDDAWCCSKDCDTGFSGECVP